MRFGLCDILKIWFEYVKHEIRKHVLHDFSKPPQMSTTGRRDTKGCRDLPLQMI